MKRHMADKLLLKICDNSWDTASRDRRELSVCRELGARVLVMARGEPSDHGRQDTDGENEVLYYGTRPLGDRVPKMLNRLAAVVIWANAARKLKADVISGHNLPGLAIGWVSNWFVPRKKKALLVYDAHEYEAGRIAGRSRLLQWAIRQAERFLIQRCAFSIMINESIAQAVQADYHMSLPIVIAKSTPGYWHLDKSESARIRREYCEKLGVPEDTFIVSYHGNIQQFRGLEEIIEALRLDPTLYSVWIGNAQTEEAKVYEQTLLQRAKETGVADRLLRYPAQPRDELWKYVSAAAAAIAMNDSRNPNYKYALPNKFFESIQSMTPIICSDTVEMGQIVKKYDIGLLVPSGDGAALAAAIERLREDRAMYERFKKNLVRAKEELCWEHEKENLKKAYQKYL